MKVIVEINDGYTLRYSEIPSRIWYVHFSSDDKMKQIETQNALGRVPPASICNEDTTHFISNYADNSISVQYNFPKLSKKTSYQNYELIFWTSLLHSSQTFR